MRVLRREALDPAVSRQRRCTAAEHPGMYVAPLYLVTVSVPNTIGRMWPRDFLRMVEGAWWACEACWQRMTRWPELTVDDGDQDAGEVDAGALVGAAHRAIGELGNVVSVLDSLLRAAENEREVAQSDARVIYRERAALVALLAAQWPSWWVRDPAEPDHPVVMIDSPRGQLSWHIAMDDLDLFPHVTRYNVAEWDGHSTPEKYGRIAAVAARLADRPELPTRTVTDPANVRELIGEASAAAGIPLQEAATPLRLVEKREGA